MIYSIPVCAVDISSLTAQVQQRLNAMKQGQPSLFRPQVPFPPQQGHHHGENCVYITMLCVNLSHTPYLIRI